VEAWRNRLAHLTAKACTPRPIACNRAQTLIDHYSHPMGPNSALEARPAVHAAAHAGAAARAITHLTAVAAAVLGPAA
jgi:hypothetical protein